MSGMMLIANNWFTNILRSATLLLDKGIYSLVQSAYAVFYNLANATLLNDRIVENFTIRMYSILGIIMVFVLAFNLLNYIVDPDKITDKKIGASAFIKDVVLALVIISLTPMLFTKLYSLQSAIITSGVIENLILGGNTDSTGASASGYIGHEDEYNSLSDYYVQNGANSMVASVYVAFLYPNDGSFTALDCETDKETEVYQDYCDAYANVKNGESLGVFEDFITNDNYNFTPFLTTVSGIVLLFFMLSFCLNLGKRVGKLAIIQLIAPVPVTLELLPNKKGLRKNWFNTLVKVYIEVFFFILVMYIIVFLISLIPDVIVNLFGNGEGFGIVKLFTVVMLIFGLLSFGKEAPQMIFDLLGIKSTGVIAAAAKRATKMAGSVTAGLGVGATSLTRNAVRGYRAARFDENGNVNSTRLKALGHGVWGGFKGIPNAGFGVARGMYANRTGGFKGITRRTSDAVNANLANQGKAWNGIKTYGTSVYNAQGVKGKAGAIFDPLIHNPATKTASKWAQGNAYSALNSQLQSYNQYKGVFDGTKVKTGSDERYMNFRKQADTIQAKLDRYDYLNNLGPLTAEQQQEFSELSSQKQQLDRDIRSITAAMDSREQNMITGKKSEITIALAQAQALIKNNTDVANIDAGLANDIMAINLDNASDQDFINTYRKLESLNKKVGSESTKIRANIAAREMAEKQKQNGNSGNKK